MDNFDTLAIFVVSPHSSNMPGFFRKVAGCGKNKVDTSESMKLVFENRFNTISHYSGIQFVGKHKAMRCDQHDFKDINARIS